MTIATTHQMSTRSTSSSAVRLAAIVAGEILRGSNPMVLVSSRSPRPRGGTSCRLSGDVDWYEAFATWKLAVVLQQMFNRFAAGDTEDGRLGQHVKPLAEQANAMLADMAVRRRELQ
ncbi:MAG: hypothetical protein ACR2QO_07695 [Acidimicrobiales bacterium]